MGDFFHSWRRKAGCVPLVLAVLFTGAWLRSLRTHDRFDFYCGPHTTIRISSAGGAIGWERGTEDGTHELVSFRGWQSYFMSDQLYGVSELRTGQSGFDWKWRWDFLGFFFGEGVQIVRCTDDFTEYEQWDLSFFPYWCLVLPLTLISAWLVGMIPGYAAARGNSPLFNPAAPSSRMMSRRHS